MQMASARRAAAAMTPRRVVAAAVACTPMFLAMVLVGCSGDDAPAAADPTATSAAAPAASTAASPAAADPSVTAVAPPAVTVDGPALLQQALDSIAGGYHFDTNVTINGVEVLVAAGDRVGDGTRLTIWANGTSVAYVVTPTASWVFPEGGEWEALDDPPSTTDPLAALRTPTSITPLAGDATSATLELTVSAASLGIPGEGDATVNVVLNAGTVAEITYNSAVDGQPAVVRSVFGTVLDATPVVPPI
ncbi:MAG: hypothetical protein AAB131_13040 [Actinomycetota bacterium]